METVQQYEEVYVPECGFTVRSFDKPEFHFPFAK